MHAATHLSHFCFTPCFPLKKKPSRNFPGFSGPLNRCGPAMCWGSPKLCFIGKIGRAGYCFKLAFIGIPKVAVGFGTDPIWTRPKRVIVFEFWASSPKRCFIFQPHPDRHGGKLLTSTCSREKYLATTAILVVTPDFCYGNHVSISWFDCFFIENFTITFYFLVRLGQRKPKKNSPWRAFRQMQACKQ